MKYVWGLVLLGMSTLLIGCAVQRSAPTCEDIMLSTLKPLLSESSSADQVAQRIHDTFQLSTEPVKVATVDASLALPSWWTNALKEGGTSITWRKGAASYALDLRNNHVLSVNVLYDQPQPSVDQVINCLGKPEKYWGYYPLGVSPRDRSAELFLFYPELGFRVRVNRGGSGEHPPTFDSKASVTQVWFVPPTLGVDVVEGFIAERDPDWQPEIASQMRSWPTKWEDIVIEAPR